MRKIAIITDSNSGIEAAEAKDLGIYVLPMPFYMNDTLYYEMGRPEFFERLIAGQDVSTSQPTPLSICELWDELLETHDEILHIPMSSALSSTCESCMTLARDYDEKVQVVDNKRISVIQRQAALNALKLKLEGKSAKDIKLILETDQSEASIYLMVDTLNYLKKGGRVTPTAAAIGTVLNIKPVLQIQGGKLDAFAKVRGVKQAKKTLLDAIQKDLDTRFSNIEMKMYAVHSCKDEDALEWQREIKERFPDYDVELAGLPFSIVCHVGDGVLAIAIAKAR